MNKQTEALKMAIDALEKAEEVDWDLSSLHVLNILQAIKACKEALEQPAQEPVAWMHRHAGEITEFNDFQSCQYCEPLYTHPAPSWQGLKMTEVWEIVGKLESDDDDTYSEGLSIEDFYRAIEQALRNKNGY